MMRIKGYQIKYLLLFFLIGFLVGFQNLFFAKFDLSILTDSSYWLETINTTSAYYFTIIMIVFWNSEKFTGSNEDYQDKQSAIKSFIVEDLDSSFYDFNDEQNLKEKIKEWKLTVKQKLHTIDKKATPIDRKAWKEKDDSNEYVVQRTFLLEQISDEYIKENIYFIKVDYEHVDESTITDGYTAKRNRKFKKENNILKITKDVAPRFLLTIIYTSFFRAFIPVYNEVDMVYIYKLAVQLIGLIMTAVFAINYAPAFIEEQIIAPLNRRLLYIKKYIDWKEAGDKGEADHS